MLIVCPNCATSYDVDVASLRPDGRQVRCVRCRMVWRAELPHADKLIAAAQALAPVRRAVEAMAEAVAGPPLPEPPAHIDIAASAAFEAPADSPPPDLAEDADLAEAADLAAGADATAPNAAVEVESPPIAPVDLDAGHRLRGIEAEREAAADAEPLEDIESVAARKYPRRAKRKRWSWPLSRLQSGMLALIIVDAIVIGWRADFVRAMPQTASFYAWIGLPVNLRGLNFDGIATATEQHDGVPILILEGNIVNDTRNVTNVPHLRFAVRNAARQEIYSWTAVASRPTLPPGEAVAFHTRLASPPPDAHDVLVRFVNRYDVLTGAR